MIAQKINAIKKCEFKSVQSFWDILLEYMLSIKELKCLPQCLIELITHYTNRGLLIYDHREKFVCYRTDDDTILISEICPPSIYLSKEIGRSYFVTSYYDIKKYNHDVIQNTTIENYTTPFQYDFFVGEKYSDGKIEHSYIISESSYAQSLNLPDHVLLVEGLIDILDIYPFLFEHEWYPCDQINVNISSHKIIERALLKMIHSIDFILKSDFTDILNQKTNEKFKIFRHKSNPLTYKHFIKIYRQFYKVPISRYDYYKALSLIKNTSLTKNSFQKHLVNNVAQLYKILKETTDNSIIITFVEDISVGGWIYTLKEGELKEFKNILEVVFDILMVKFYF